MRFRQCIPKKDTKRAAAASATAESRNDRETASIITADEMPVRMRFERVFGPDWGPERITVRNPSITPDG